MTMLFEEILRDADPAADVAPYGADARRRLLDAAISEVDDAAAADGGDATTPTATSPRGGSRHRRVRLLLAACAALVVASLGYQSVTASVGAAEAAEVLGQAAIHASDPPAKPGQYWEITRIGTNLADGGDGESDRRYLVRTTHIAYVSVDGRRPTWLVAKPAVTVRQVFGPPQERGGHGRGEAWTSNLSPEQKPGWWGSRRRPGSRAFLVRPESCARGCMPTPRATATTPTTRRSSTSPTCCVQGSCPPICEPPSTTY